jgi:hypothetical protein
VPVIATSLVVVSAMAFMGVFAVLAALTIGAGAFVGLLR